MFCSNCGKTLKPGEDQCPHCGMPVGESPFSSMSYTAAPPPEDAAPKRTSRRSEEGYAPATRTTYTQMDEQAQGDVYSRTTYRAPLSDEENALPEEKQSGQQINEQEPVAMDGESASQDISSAVPLDKVYESIPDLEGEEQTEIPPLPPVNRPGISEEVRRYMEEAEQERRQAAANPGKKRFSLFNLMGGRDEREEETMLDADLSEVEEPSGAVEEAGEAQPQGEASEDKPDKNTKPAPQKEKNAAGKPGMQKLSVKKIIGLVVVLAVIVVVLVQGVRYLKYITTPRAKVPTVSVELYDKGLALIESHVTNEYRADIIALYQQDASGLSAMERQQKEMEELQALYPENEKERLADDDLFVKALVAIQENINKACTYDFLAASNASNDQLSGLQTQADEQWGEVQNLLKRLKNATETKDLKNLNTGAKDILEATATPTQTPKPEFKTLKKGQKNSEAIKNLQNRLYELGYFNDIRDGDFGSKTQQAVKRFQKAAGLEADGVATPELQELLYSDDAPRKADASATSAASPAPTGTKAAADTTLKPANTPAAENTDAA